MQWSIEQTPYDDPDADLLRAAQRRELDERYGGSDHEPGVVPSAADVPVFLVARDPSGRPVACGGLRLVAEDVLGPDVVEIKRMYASPATRGTGVAVAVLRSLEDAARELGAQQLVLETGTGQPDAIRFYEREGYRQITPYGAYEGSAGSVCFARSLECPAR
jgi:GNAT superfamily N-acetyltransferase